jgi:hypothetical protein
MMRAAVWLVAAMLGLGAGLVATAGGASSPQQAGNAQTASPAKAGDDSAWGEPTDEPVQAGQTPPAATPEQGGDSPAPEPKNAAKKDADTPADEPVQAGRPTPPPPTPEQAGSAPATEREKAGSIPATEPEQAKQPALTLPAGTPEQQQLEKDTSRLLQLVQELKVEVDKAGKDTLSLAAIRKADEIQKLTKDLKERMRERGQVPGNRP